MAFAGRALVVADAQLEFISSTSREQARLGLPLASIRECTLPGIPSLGPDMDPEAFRAFLTQLEPLVALLPLLPSQDRTSLVSGLLCLADAGDWHTVYRWCNRLLEGAPANGEEAHLRLLRARGLFAMGLIDQAAAEARHLVEQSDPLAVPARLCQLMAALAQAEGDYEAAAEWSALPGLRIPAEPIQQLSATSLTGPAIPAR